MTNDLFYFGLTQKTAPLEIRNQLRADRESQFELLSHLARLAGGRIVLATCERFEVYASAKIADRKAWTSFLANWFSFPADLLAKCVRTHSGSHAAEHFFRVAAGLESRIVGERQILGQVRNAHQFALEKKTLDAQLSLLVRTAIRTGKRVRQETNLDSGRSIVTMAMDWLSHQGGSVSGKSVGIVGSGRLAALVASEVVQQSPRRVTITGRNESRAVELASRYGAQCAAMSALRQSVALCDVVFTCTTSPSYLVESALIGDRRPAPLRLIDLCVPRNVDPAVAGLPFVKLSHLDEMVAYGLSTCRPAGDAPECEATRQAETIVREELETFLQWRKERRAAPMIAELVGRAAGSGVGKRALHEQIMRMKSGAAV